MYLRTFNTLCLPLSRYLWLCFLPVYQCAHISTLQIVKWVMPLEYFAMHEKVWTNEQNCSMEFKTIDHQNLTNSSGVIICIVGVKTSCVCVLIKVFLFNVSLSKNFNRTLFRDLTWHLTCSCTCNCPRQSVVTLSNNGFWSSETRKRWPSKMFTRTLAHLHTQK